MKLLLPYLTIYSSLSPNISSATMPSLFLTTAALAAGFACLPGALAGFNPSSSSNVVVYWGKALLVTWTHNNTDESQIGQNSYGQGTGNLAQQRLATYCASK